MTRPLTAAEFKAINSQKKIKGKRLRRKAIEKGVKKERQQDPREVNYYE